MTTEVFLFEDFLEIGFAKSNIKVYKRSDEEHLDIFVCIIDNSESFELAREIDGSWFDYENGFTNMSEIIGNLINSRGC